MVDWFSERLQHWPPEVRAALFGSSSVIPLWFSPGRDGLVSGTIHNITATGDFGTPGANAKPELLCPARKVDIHPCPGLDLIQLIADNVSEPVNLGTFSQIQQRLGCGLCVLVRQGFEKLGGALLKLDFGCLLYIANDTRLQDTPTPYLQIWAAPLTLYAAAGLSTPHHGVPRLDIHILNSSGGQLGQQVSYRRIGSEADLDVARQWLSICEKSHTSCSAVPELSERSQWASGLKLIDTKRRKVVDACYGERYVALSYVWGPQSGQRFTATTDFLKDPDHCGVNLPLSLPHTIEDAIDLVSRLRLDRLWVDSICIAQDSEHKMDQIRQMDRIYSNAVLTIVAGAGRDADAGLPGLGSQSRAHQIIERYQGVEIAILESTVLRLRTSTWASRGWTFQEQMLSNRLLFITDNEMSFMCPTGIARECIGHAGHFQNTNLDKDLLHFIGNPLYDVLNSAKGYSTGQEGRVQSLHAYFDIIERYTTRRLSFPGDILNAITGVLAKLEPSLGTFAWGLPSDPIFLASSLLWYGDGSEQRRMTGDDPAGNTFPSWSWAGWTGKISHDWAWCNPGNIKPRILQSGGTEQRILSEDDDIADHSKSLLFTAKMAVSFKLKDPLSGDDVASLSAHLNGKRTYLLIDVSGRACGEIMSPRTWAIGRLGESIVLLGVSQSRETKQREVWYNGWGGAYGQSTIPSTAQTGADIINCSAQDPWSTINVMLVEALGECKYERRGIGFMHLDAWESAYPQPTNINLV